MKYQTTINMEHDLVYAIKYTNKYTQDETVKLALDK